MNDLTFFRDFVIRQIEGQRLTEIRTFTYREGGIEIAPGSILPCIIPYSMRDRNITMTIDGEIKEVFIKGPLEDGDRVVVGKYNGISTYVILDKI